MTILQFLAIPWLFTVIFLYLAVVEIKNDVDFHPEVTH